MGNIKLGGISSSKDQINLDRSAKYKKDKRKSVWSSASQLSGENLDQSWNMGRHDDNNRIYDFYKTPAMDEILNFEVDWSSEQALIDKGNQMQDDIQEIQNIKIA